MNIRQYLIHRQASTDLSRFADFSRQLKTKYKTLDGYAFDFDDEDILSIKFYYKIYTKKNIYDSNFARWFFENDMFYYAFAGYLNKDSLIVDSKSLSGLNFAIKYNTKTKQVIRSVYFQYSNKSSLVIHCDGVNVWTNKYYYLYNHFIIKCINKLFKLNMPNHNEAIELSFRGKNIHTTIYPRFNRKSLDLQESKLYCQKVMPKLLRPKAPHGQNLTLAIHCYDKNSHLVTKGYTSNNAIQKIYFGCFDWEKSIFEN
jgi:hypothetical protein